MKQFIFAALLVLQISCTEAQKPQGEFSFHLFQEPVHLDPALSTLSEDFIALMQKRGLKKRVESVNGKKI